jgi:type IX secretion system PorP/SprF family membrane protein
MIGAVLLVSALPAEAQQRPLISNYIYTGLAINPAYAVRQPYTSFTALYRDQWVNVPGSPKTSSFFAQSGFKDKNLGIGLSIVRENIGVHLSNSVYASYAYQIRLSNGTRLAMGLQGGFDHIRSDWTRLNLPPGSQHDPIFQGETTQMVPNFGTGIYLFSDQFYLGLSVPYILTSNLNANTDLYQDVRYSRNYYMTGGLLLHMSEKMVFKPSALIRAEENMPVSFDLNISFFYAETVELGCSYRHHDSFVGLLGFQVNRFFKFNYAYDLTVSGLNPYSRGSHELMLQYRINFSAPRKHRMCPGPLYF